MKAKILSEPIDKMPSDTLVLSIFSDEKPLRGANGLVDWRLCGRISKLIMNKTVSCEYKKGTLILSEESKRTPKILVVGLGNSTNFNEKKLNTISHYIARTLKKLNTKKVSLAIPGSSYFPQNYSKTAEILITAFADSYEKKDNLFELIIYETERRIQMVCEGAKQAKTILKNKLMLTLDV